MPPPRFPQAGAAVFKRGWLHKRGAFNTARKKRWFVLRGGPPPSLQYSRQPGEAALKTLLLSGATLVGSAQLATLGIRVRGDERTYWLEADSAPEARRESPSPAVVPSPPPRDLR